VPALALESLTQPVFEPVSKQKGGSMNKKFAIAWIVVFVVWMLGSFVVHGSLLHADYSALPNLMRTEEDAQKYFPLMIVAHLIMAGVDLFAGRRSQALDRAGDSLRHCGGAARHRSDLHDLLRRAADAERTRREADRVRRHPGRDPGHRRRVLL
jgi:hypothetical protein